MVEAVAIGVFVVACLAVIGWSRRPGGSRRQRERAMEAYRRDIDADQ